MQALPAEARAVLGTLGAHGCNHSKLGKKKVKSGIGQWDCARNTGINGAVPTNQLCVSLPEAIERQRGLIIV